MPEPLLRCRAMIVSRIIDDRFEVGSLIGRGSAADVYGAQGQDFTFNILSAIGVSYQVNDRLKLSVGALYEHLSNAGQTDPNPSLNLFGPQVGLTYGF